MRKCPRCGLVSPDRSVRCECGFLFDLDDRAAVSREHARWRESARIHMVGGILLAGLGAGMSILSYVIAVERGGFYAVWVGMMIAGCTLALRSYARIRKIRAAEQPLDRGAG